MCCPAKKSQLTIACWVAFENLVHGSNFKLRREVAVRKYFHSHEVIFVHCEILCRNAGTSPAELGFALQFMSASGPCVVNHLFFINWSADAEQIPGWCKLFMFYLLWGRSFTLVRILPMLFQFSLKGVAFQLYIFFRLVYFQGTGRKSHVVQIKLLDSKTSLIQWLTLQGSEDHVWDFTATNQIL